MNRPYFRLLAAVTAAAIFGSIVVLTGVAAYADTVDDLVEFVPGTTASADEVNSNFSEVANAVNGNDVLIAGLRESLESPGILFGRTVFVLSNGGSAAANCDMLRETLAETDGVATDPVRIKLERGTYDCGSAPIMMKRFVTIEGAGRNLSTIIGNADADAGDQGVVIGVDDAALRNLSVENLANGSGFAIAINTGGGRMSVTNVAVKVDSATVRKVLGIFASGGSLGLTNVSVQTSGSAGESQGIQAESGAQLNMMNTWVRNQGNAGNPAALELRDSSATGFGILFSSNVFGLLGRGDSVFELVDGTVIGSRGLGADFTGTFTCVGVADEDFTALAPDCS